MSTRSAPRHRSAIPFAIGDFVLHNLSNAVGIIVKVVAAPCPIARVRIPHWGVHSFAWQELSKIEPDCGVMICTERSLSPTGVEVTRLVQSLVPARAAAWAARYPPAQRTAYGVPARC